jgi:hypothetical protein
MMWTPAGGRRVEHRLRELIAEGRPIEEAIRTLHQGAGFGALLIYPAAEQVAGLASADAKRLVVRALSPIWHGLRRTSGHGL